MWKKNLLVSKYKAKLHHSLKLQDISKNKLLKTLVLNTGLTPPTLV